MPLSVRWVSRWVACSVCQGWPRARRSFPPSRGPAEGPAEGVSNEAELACFPRVGFLPSSEAEMWCAVEGLGGEASSEAEIALRVRGGPRMGRTAELGRGPSVYWALWDLERIWAPW